MGPLYLGEKFKLDCPYGDELPSRVRALLPVFQLINLPFSHMLALMFRALTQEKTPIRLVWWTTCFYLCL